MTTKVPEGVKVVEEKEEFSYTIKKENEDAGEKEAGAGVEQTGELRAVDKIYMTYLEAVCALDQQIKSLD